MRQLREPRLFSLRHVATVSSVAGKDSMLKQRRLTQQVITTKRLVDFVFVCVG